MRTNTPTPDALPVAVHQSIIEDHAPLWLINADTDTHARLRQSARQALRQPWLETARSTLPDLLAQLPALYAAHREHQQRLAPRLEQLSTLEDFAAPRLAQTISARFGVDLDVRDTYLFHASHAQVANSFQDASKDPVEQSNTALRIATRPLLQAALQNFQAEETRPGAMDKDSRIKAEVFSSYQILGPYIQGTAVNMSAHGFAELARHLDLGGTYQTHIDTVLDAGAASDFQAFERSALTLEAHLAHLREHIDAPTHAALLHLADGQGEVRLHGKPLYCSALRLWDVELTGILMISPDRDTAGTVQPVVAYIPEDPVAPLRTYESAQAFHNALRDRLFDSRYMEFFSRFIPARQRSKVLDTLHSHLYPKVSHGRWYERRWLSREPDRSARLNLSETRLPALLFEALYRRKLATIKDNARFNGVPTAEQDERSHEQRLAWWFDKAMNVLNLAAFAVPALGVVMLGVTAVQMCYEVYEGIESWEQGEREQALGYLLDVVQNIALMAAMGGVSQVGLPMAAIETPALVEGLTPVQLPSGKTRLWKPDLTPFAHDIILPADLKPNALGLYDYQGKQWLAVDGQHYSVKATSSGGHVIQHPSARPGYEPPLMHNGAGAWRLPTDRPRQMQGLPLLRRLGFDALTWPDEMARNMLRISDTGDAVLRRAFERVQRPPALLADTALRLQLDHELSLTGQQPLFDTLYMSLQSSPIKGVERLQQALPARLPRAVAEELWSNAVLAERQQVLNGNGLPIRLAEEARLYRQQVRLTRAYEGLYLESVPNPDTDTLILHSLEHLPGWSADVRLEIRDVSVSGPLLDSVGTPDAPIRKVLIRDEGGYMARDAEDRHLNGRADLYASILHALPDAERRALGVPHTGQRADLQRLIQEHPLLRYQLRKALAMPEIKPAFRSPMRLADGRVGYPMSGRPGTHWVVTREYLMDKLSLLEFDHLWPSEILERLRAAGMSFEGIDARLDVLLEERRILHDSLETWVSRSQAQPGPEPVHHNDRSRIAAAILRHWSRHSLPELGTPPEPLQLSAVAIEDFPEQLPAFFQQRVTALQLDDLLPSARLTAQGITARIDTQALQSLLSRFGNTRSLTLTQDLAVNATIRYFPGLLGDIARVLPNLTDLSLINLQLWLDQAEMNGLLPLLELRNLNLSGNRFNQLSPLELDWLRPHRLILERTDLRYWPSWLDNRVPGQLRELSLANNRLAELPSHILDNPYNTNSHTVIDLRGNPLSVGTIVRARLDQALADRAFSFLVNTPPALEINLGVLMSERNALSEAINHWSEASTSTSQPNPAALAQRQRIGVALMDHWRAYARGETQTPLHLEDVDLAEFPRRLPNFFYLRVRSMRLHQITATEEQLGTFLKFLINLSSLRISAIRTPMLEPPQALLGLPTLRNLSLIDMNLQIDQRWTEFFGRLPQLQHLELDGNLLGEVQEASGLSSLNLRWLSLRNTGLHSWPNWVLDLLPMPLETLILDNNQLQSIPEELLANPRRQWGHSEISLIGNPLSHDAMLYAHTSQHYGRTYSFEMDLPQEIRDITWYESHDSDSTMDDSDASRHTHSPSTSSTLEASTVDPWLDNNTERTATWQQLEVTGDANNLLDLIGYLQQSADYRNQSSRPILVERVWRVLEAAAGSAELRSTLNGIAEEPLRLIRDEDTCADGVMVEFNQMEVMVFTRQALESLPTESRGTALFALTRRLYRLHELDRIAREQANGRDEAEVRLAYRLHWAEVLDLPVPPQRMLYEAHARLQPDELDTALARVQAGEQGDSFLAFAITQTPWVSYLREENSRGFEGLEQIYRDNLNRLSERYEQQGLNLDSPEYEAQARELEQQYQDDQLTLLRALTTDAAIG